MNETKLIAEKNKIMDDLASQRAILERLRSDNRSLEQELSLEKHMTALATSESAINEIEKLQSIGDTFARRIQLEKRRIEELDIKIAAGQKAVLGQRGKVGGVNASKENNNIISKQIRILERRLDLALVKYNDTLARNKGLREKVDELRRERVIFDGIYKKLEKEMHEKKKNIDKLLEKANIAYAQRDKAKKEIAKLNKFAADARMKFENEWKAAGALIDEDRKGMVNQKQKLAKAAMFLANNGNLSIEDEKKMKKRIARGAWNIGKDKAAMSLSKDKVESYEAAFSKIQAATGIQDIDELVEKFIKAEDKNFALFSRVNKLAAEADGLEQSISDIKLEIEKYKGKSNNAENQRKRILKDLEAKLEKAETKADHYDEKYKEAMNVVTVLKKGIENLFSRIGCYTEGFAEMLGNQGVTDSNIMQYLGIIEQRTNEILQMYSAAQKKGSAKHVRAIAATSPTMEISIEGTGEDSGIRQKIENIDKILAEGPTAMASQRSLTVQLPDANFFVEEKGGSLDERPLPLSELQRKTESRMKERKEATNNNKQNRQQGKLTV